MELICFDGQKYPSVEGKSFYFHFKLFVYFGRTGKLQWFKSCQRPWGRTPQGPDPHRPALSSSDCRYFKSVISVIMRMRTSKQPNRLKQYRFPDYRHYHSLSVLSQTALLFLNTTRKETFKVDDWVNLHCCSAVFAPFCWISEPATRI